MLIGALLVIASGLLVAGFVTGTTTYAIGALVLSVIAAVLYGIALKRVAADERAATDAEDETADETEEAAAKPSAAKSDGKKVDAMRAAQPEVKSAAKKSEAKPTAAKKPDVTSTAAKKPEATQTAAKKPEATPTAAKKPEATQTAAKKPEATQTAAKKPEATQTPAKKPDVKPAPAEKRTEEQPSVAAAAATPEQKPEPGTAPDPAVAAGSQVSDIVHVVPGRMRYHVEGCKLLDGQEAEVLTVDDAKDEGFSACSRCAGRKVLTSRS